VLTRGPGRLAEVCTHAGLWDPWGEDQSSVASNSSGCNGTKVSKSNSRAGLAKGGTNREFNAGLMDNSTGQDHSHAEEYHGRRN
jgi:hypothetical protein